LQKAAGRIHRERNVIGIPVTQRSGGEPTSHIFEDVSGIYVGRVLG
jgi:hypothetical protein